MNTIRVNTSSPYPILVGKDLLKDTGGHIRHLMPGAETAVLITDDTVGALYGAKVRESIEAAGLTVRTYVFPHGESSKNGKQYLEILNYLAEQHLTRSDVIAALGGGVTGDLAGFAAATYLRGIRFLQIPTSLLAQVDSSVGGKTAIDLPAGKNLAGAFYQPSLVLCDLDTLNTLPEEIFTDGCAEVIKYGMIGDENLFRHLKERGAGFDREYTITRCIEMKRDLVEEDEFDRGSRQLLNFGHTLGHAAEMLSGYRLSHGRAVAMGMAAITRAAACDGICAEECAEEIEYVLQRFHLPYMFANTYEELHAVMLSDKKRRGGKISLIVPEKIGRCVIREYPIGEMQPFISLGLQHN